MNKIKYEKMIDEKLAMLKEEMIKEMIRKIEEEQENEFPKHGDDYAEGYFTEVYRWGGSIEDSSVYHIVYANDTKVMYIIMEGSQDQSGMSPLYNADGSLQICDGE